MDYRFDPIQQRLAAQRLGTMLRRWRLRNGWTLHTAEAWGDEAGFQLLPETTLYGIESGITWKPRPEVFFALGEINRRLAVRDYRGIISQDLKPYIEDAEPIKGDDDAVWAPVDFWCCHVGLQEVPSAYQN